MALIDKMRLISKNVLIDRIARRMVSAAVVIIVGSALAHAASLADYHKRIDAARDTIAELQMMDVDDSDIARIERRNLSLLRTTLPRNEKVDVPGGSIDVDNAWLHDELDAYLREVNLQKRTAILASIDERLGALSQKITELETAAAAGPTKDEEKRKLSEILGRDEYQKPAKTEESLFQRWRREFLEWLARVFPQVNFAPQESAGLGSLSFWLQVLLYMLLTAAVGYLIYRILPFFSGRFSRRTKTSGDDRVILGERIGDHESAGDLFDEAERLARGGELRLAIRKGYIALLCNLADRKLIGLARHKTNRDYLRDVRARHELFENLRGLTGSFETSWYGSRESDEKAWEDFREKYHRAVRGV